MRTVAFVGAGPTTIYMLCAFVDETTAPAKVTFFEAQPRAGLGTPYRPGWNDPAMLSNIASIEIPPIGETLIDWLRRQPRARLHIATCADVQTVVAAVGEARAELVAEASGVSEAQIARAKRYLK